MTAIGVRLLGGLGVTVARARGMSYAAIWLPDDCIMILDADRDDDELDDGDRLPDAVRPGATVPEAVPADW